MAEHLARARLQLRADRLAWLWREHAGERLGYAPPLIIFWSTDAISRQGERRSMAAQSADLVRDQYGHIGELGKRTLLPRAEAVICRILLPETGKLEKTKGSDRKK